jgi:predicted site-specific integrase-resolvase
MDDMRDELLTLAEAAKLLKVNPRTLNRWEKLGAVAFVRLPFGRPRISAAEVRRLMGNAKE